MFEQTPLPGLLVYNPKVHGDERGYFFESFNKNLFQQSGISCDFVQDNQSYSQYGTIRGLHFQKGEHAQAKLVRVLSGKVLDVAVDIRPDSKTFGHYFSILLSDDNFKQLYIPRGFAHGFSVLSTTAIFAYKCDNYYNPESESGINYLDSNLSIDWHLPLNDICINQRDKSLPHLHEHGFNITAV